MKLSFYFLMRGSIGLDYACVILFYVNWNWFAIYTFFLIFDNIYSFCKTIIKLATFFCLKLNLDLYKINILRKYFFSLTSVNLIVFKLKSFINYVSNWKISFIKLENKSNQSKLKLNTGVKKIKNIYVQELLVWHNLFYIIMWFYL